MKYSSIIYYRYIGGDILFFEDNLRDKLSRCFDLDNNYKLGNEVFDFLGSYNQKTSKYVIQKKNEIYAFEINQYLLYKKIDKLDVKTLDDLKTLLNNHCTNIVDINKDHMSSEIIFIIETELDASKELQNAIKKFKFYKSFKFGFEGWINGGIVVINPQGTEGISNKVAKKLLKSFLT